MTLQTSPTLASLAVALSAAQGELTDAIKTSFNPGFKSKYADLAEVLQTVRPVLSKHGLSIVQAPGMYTKESGTVAVTTLLLHKSGEYVRDTLYVPVSKPDAQGLGSATTYGRRYGLAAIVGISQDDDDGNAAVGRVKAPQRDTVELPPPAEALIKRLATVDGKPGFDALATDFAKLPAAEQAKVLPAVAEARKRLGL